MTTTGSTQWTATIAADTWRDAVALAYQALPVDADDTRFRAELRDVLHGVELRATESGIRITAADGYVASRSTVPCDYGVPWSTIAEPMRFATGLWMPRWPIDALASSYRQRGHIDWPVVLSYGDGALAIEWDGKNRIHTPAFYRSDWPDRALDQIITRVDRPGRGWMVLDHDPIVGAIREIAASWHVGGLAEYLPIQTIRVDVESGECLVRGYAHVSEFVTTGADPTVPECEAVGVSYTTGGKWTRTLVGADLLLSALRAFDGTAVVSVGTHAQRTKDTNRRPLRVISTRRHWLEECRDVEYQHAPPVLPDAVFVVMPRVPPVLTAASSTAT